MLTTKADHNDIRHSPIERVTWEVKTQVSDGADNVPVAYKRGLTSPEHAEARS